jgi:hypothetical protein
MEVATVPEHRQAKPFLLDRGRLISCMEIVPALSASVG